MSGYTMLVELRDGSQVPLDTFNALCTAAEALLERGDLYAIHSLIKKCQDASFKLIPSQFGDARSTLKQYNLIDENDSIHEDIRKIVLNSIKESASSLRVAIPVKGDFCEITFSKVKPYQT
jgi:hypothetical protein